MKKREENGECPPRFQIQCVRKSTNMSSDLHFSLSVSKTMKDGVTKCIGMFSLVKNVIGNKLAS